MARSRLGRTVAVIHVVLGIAIFTLATLAVFLIAEPYLGLPGAGTVAGVATVVLPIGLTILLFRNVAALRSRTRIQALRALLYAFELWALLLVVLIATLGRVPAARALAGVPGRFPHAGALPHGAARWLARVIAPASAPVLPANSHAVIAPAPDAHAPLVDATAPVAPPPAPDVAPPPPAPVVPAELPDASNVADAPDVSDVVDVIDVAVADSTPRGTDAATATATTDAALAVNNDAGPGAVHVCDRALAVFPADLGHDPIDEIVVECTDGVRALWLQAGGLFERTFVAPHAPAGATVVMREPRVVDANNDGRADLLVCAHWTDATGNVTGGGLWLLAGGENGQFLAPTSVLATACGAVDLGDVDGDGQPELLVALEGNPSSAARPNGELVWLERTGARWTQHGRTPLRRDPLRMWLADVNNDGIVDVAVQHGGPGDGVTVNPGSRRGPLAVDIRLTVPPAPERTRDVPARLDDDAAADAVSIEGGGIRLRVSSGAPSPSSVTRALDWVTFTPP